LAIIDLLLQSIFLGFTFYNVLFVITLLTVKKENAIFNSETESIAVILVRWSGITYLILLVNTVIQNLLEEEVSQINRMFGPYWLAFWIYPFAFFFLTQLLWVKKIEKNRVIKVFISTFILIALSFEGLIFLLTRFFRDYLPTSWSIYTSYLTGNTYWNLAIEIGIFFTFIFLTRILVRLKKTFDNNLKTKC
jgi:hypothetical protein